MDFSKVARRLRTSPYPLTSMDKAFSMVLTNSPPLPVIEKNYKGIADFISKCMNYRLHCTSISETYSLLTAMMASSRTVPLPRSRLRSSPTT